MILYIEAMTDYVRDAIRTMRREGYAAIEPRAAAQEAWNADIQRRMRSTVWVRGGCTSLVPRPARPQPDHLAAVPRVLSGAR